MAIKALSVGVALVVFVPVTSCTAALVGVRPPWVTSRTICRTGMMIERKGRRWVRECPGSRGLMTRLTGRPIVRRMARRLCRSAVCQMTARTVAGRSGMNMGGPRGG